MKNFTTRMMIAAAALTMAAGAAQAQYLKAEIPFNFRVQNAVLPSGEYMVTKTTFTGRAIFQLTNMDTHKAVLLVTATLNTQRDAPVKADGLLTFQCYERNCALASMWDGDGLTYQFYTAKPEAAGPMQIAKVTIHRM